MIKYAQVPGLSGLSTTMCFQLNQRKKRESNRVRAIDENPDKSSVLKPDGGSPDQLDTTNSPTLTSRIDIFEFYGAFLSHEKKYVGKAPSPNRSSAYSTQNPPRSAHWQDPSRYAKASFSLRTWSGLNSTQHTHIKSVTPRGTAHSDNDSDESITWEQFQAQKERIERESKAKEAADLARENGILLLGEPNIPVMDLMEFSPIIGPLFVTATSTNNQSSTSDVIPLDLDALAVDHDVTSEMKFGGMVLKGLRNQRDQKQKTVQQDALTTDKIASPSPRITQELDNKSLSGSEDLTEL